MIRMIKNAVANLMNALRMKLQHDTCLAYLHIHIADVSLLLLFAILCPISLLSINLFLIVRIRPVFYSSEMSIRMLVILYKRLTITTNALPSIRMACDCLRINCEYAFLANFRNMFPILPRPCERPRMLTNTNECLAIPLRSL